MKYLRELRFLAEYALLWPIVALARALSPSGAERMVWVVSRVVYLLLGRDRRWAYKNLQAVFGDTLTPLEKKKIVLGSFETIVRTRVECIRWTQEWMIDHVTEEGAQGLRDLRADPALEGKGIIVISGHLGNFEMIPAYCYYWKFPSTVMYRPQDNWRVEKLMLGARSEYLPNAVSRSTVGLMSLGYALQEGGQIGLLVDMNTIENPIFVNALGYEAASPPGAAALALSTGAPVVLAVSVREKNGKHRIIFHPPFQTIRTGNKREDIRLNTEQYMKALDSYILAYPEQYNWPHPRWRYRPDGSFWTLDTPIEQIESERMGPARERQDDPTPAAIKATKMKAPRLAA